MSEQNRSVIERRQPFSSALEQSGSWQPFLGLLDDFFAERPRLSGLARPDVDITETEDEYRVRAELPGVAKGDVSVEMEGDLLTLRGEKRDQRDEKTEKGRRLECSYGAFSRSFTLPPDADSERVSAEFKDGVLAIEIAKSPESKPKQIAVKG